MAQLRRQTILHVNSTDYSESIVRNWSVKASAQDFRKSAENCKRWVALKQDKIVGFCEHNFTGELSRIYVYKNHMREAIGTELLNVAEISLAEYGFREIVLYSTITAKNFYENNGYIVVQVTSHDDGALVYKMLKKMR